MKTQIKIKGIRFEARLTMCACEAFLKLLRSGKPSQRSVQRTGILHQSREAGNTSPCLGGTEMMTFLHSRGEGPPGQPAAPSSWAVPFLPLHIRLCVPSGLAPLPRLGLPVPPPFPSCPKHPPRPGPGMVSLPTPFPTATLAGAPGPLCTPAGHRYKHTEAKLRTASGGGATAPNS